ncbi:MAG: bifunctional phosphoribosylaminoimidazolecarboxamide formyltransferase/IMP cyclohydrolase [Bacteroidales bacterium]
MKTIQRALISVYYKEGLDKLLEQFRKHGVELYSTGGTYSFLSEQGFDVRKVEDLTEYPSILDGRVKTLHPKVFGGILGRPAVQSHKQEMEQYGLPAFDMVVVDLYPFEETVASTDDPQQIIEKIDIGGISLIRAAAKNFEEVLVVPASRYYDEAAAILEKNDGAATLDDRRQFATYGFRVSAHYDTAIFNWFNRRRPDAFQVSFQPYRELRYGENPHQRGAFFGPLDDLFEQLNGKALSYNNLGDLDAALRLIGEFDEPTVAILKHTNACGLASASILSDAWKAALEGDPVSAFGGVIAVNRTVDMDTAAGITKLFFEIIIAPDYEPEALELLKSKKTRIILRKKSDLPQGNYFRSALNGVLVQDQDTKSETEADLKVVTKTAPDARETEDLIFANKIVKHTKSNAIVLVKNKQLCGSGTGQTSRVDALKQAIIKAGEFGLSLEGAVMASDAFFPFADSVELAHKAGIRAVIQPGGSVRDQESIDYCNQNGVAMVFTGTRHFKH